jgi:hypothetical protein
MTVSLSYFTNIAVQNVKKLFVYITDLTWPLNVIIIKKFYFHFSSPTPDQRRDVCRAIISKFPFLADIGGGYVSCVVSSYFVLKSVVQCNLN